MDCEMHLCLRDSMKVSRWAGMFPVEGLNKTDIGQLRFNTKSFYTLYYLSTIFLQTVMTGLIMYWFFSHDLNLATLSLLAFFVTGLSSAMLLLKLAREWPGLMRRAAYIERQVSAIRIIKIRSMKFTTLTYVVLILAAIEHLLSIVYKVKNVLLCEDEDNNNYSSENHLEIYFTRMFPFVFEYITFNYVTMSICVLANLQATFLWNFTDVMTMCFSLYLVSYFQNFNTVLNSQRLKKTQNWEQLRIYYSKLVALVQAVDSRMCYLLFLSISTNLFFICLQFYYTLSYGVILKFVACPQSQHQAKRDIDRGVNLIYFVFSSTFLVSRATTMLFLAANVHTAAVKPKYALSWVSHTEYSIHVQRFNRQLRYTTTALSGVFFYVTRGMILKVFATIITYELVMLQFNR